MKSLIKWTGGRSLFAEQLCDRIDFIDFSRQTYYEPFVTDAALLLTLLPKSFVIGSPNPVLRTFYRVLSEHPLRLWLGFLALQEQYLLDPQNTYYKVRYDYNHRAERSVDDVTLASEFFFLSKACLNGIWHEDQNGQFDRSLGTLKTKRLVVDSVFEDVSEYLSAALKSRLHSSSFSTSVHGSAFLAAVGRARIGDFAFFDPPYEDIWFDDYQTAQLKKAYRNLTVRGVYVMLVLPEGEPWYKDSRSFSVNTLWASKVASRSGRVMEDCLRVADNFSYVDSVIENQNRAREAYVKEKQSVITDMRLPKIPASVLSEMLDVRKMTDLQVDLYVRRLIEAKFA